MSDAVSWPDAIGFEDVLDGYFPLAASLAQMLARWGAEAALVTLSQAPLLVVPGLRPEAPVPLNTVGCRMGLIGRLTVRVGAEGLSGAGTWRWLDGRAPGAVLDPRVRLAEPAAVEGVLARVGEVPGPPGRLGEAMPVRFGHGASSGRVWGPFGAGLRFVLDASHGGYAEVEGPGLYAVGV